jgi:hypothetical protein
MSVIPDTEIMNQAVQVESVDPREQNLYKIGGAAALLCALVYVIAAAILIPSNRAGPPPATPLEWFSLFQSSAITGLFYLGLADIVIMLLWGPLSLALYASLTQSKRAWSLIATSFIFVGMAVFLATNIAFSMLSLGQQYAAAATEAEKASIVAAGQTLVVISQGTGGQYLGMPFAWFGGLILSVVMLRSRAFGKVTAWAGIVGLGLLIASVPFAGYTTAGPTTTLVSAIVTVTYMGGGLLSLAWYILVGRKLFKLRHFRQGAL